MQGSAARGRDSERDDIMTSIHTATYAQIDALREEALMHGDLVMARICDLAIHGEIEPSAMSELPRADRSRLCAMTQGDAQAECDRVIRSAQAEVAPAIYGVPAPTSRQVAHWDDLRTVVTDVPSWDFEGFWAVVIGRTPSRCVAEFDLSGDLTAWVNEAAAQAWQAGGQGSSMPEEWAPYIARATEMLQAEVAEQDEPVEIRHARNAEVGDTIGGNDGNAWRIVRFVSVDRAIVTLGDWDDVADDDADGGCTPRAMVEASS